jgi:hypothetical protein
MSLKRLRKKPLKAGLREKRNLRKMESNRMKMGRRQKKMMRWEKTQKTI